MRTEVRGRVAGVMVRGEGFSAGQRAVIVRCVSMLGSARRERRIAGDVVAQLERSDER